MGKEKGTIGIQTWVDPDIHAKLSQVSKDCGVSLKFIMKALVGWASEKTKEDLLRAGVSLPLWPTDKEYDRLFSSRSDFKTPQDTD